MIEESSLGRMIAMMNHGSSLDDRMGEWTLREMWDGQFTRFVREDVRVTPPDPEGGPWTDEYREQVFVCENPDGTEYTWENASMAVAPIQPSARLRPPVW